MFGSLVIALPVAHTGGVLSFAHGNRTWSLDSGELIAQANEPTIAYAVFFSDVEHEVLPVTSGNRVTLTYNLRWGSKPTRTQHTGQSEACIKSILTKMLADDAFMPDGGLLGFGLQYQYPSAGPMLDKDVLKYLKGTDAALYRACVGLGYDIKSGGIWTGGYEPTQWLLSEEPDFGWTENEDLSCAEEVSIPLSGHSERYPLGDLFQWAIPLTSRAKLETDYIAYGNQVCGIRVQAFAQKADIVSTSGVYQYFLRRCMPCHECRRGRHPN
jgi:hypothetical protein